MALSKRQVDQLGERLRGAEAVGSDIDLLDEYRASFTDSFDVAHRRMLSCGFEPTLRRTKTTASIVGKLRREAGMKLSKMQDIAGIRIVVVDFAAQEAALAAMSRVFPEARVKDRRLVPSHGYRAVHLIPKIDRRAIEIQLRT